MVDQGQSNSSVTGKSNGTLARHWFREWLGSHKARNPHGRFHAYELGGFANVYQSWVMALEERGTTLQEATRASRRLQQKAPEQGLLPEQHLPRLLQILVKIQAPRFAAEEQARKVAERAIRENNEAEVARVEMTWRLLSEQGRDRYRRQVREVCPNMRRRTVDFIARSVMAEESTNGPGKPSAILAAWKNVDHAATEVSENEPYRRKTSQFRLARDEAIFEHNQSAEQIDKTANEKPEPTPETIRRSLESRRAQLARLGAVITPQAIAG